jgi:hypothetical protein
MPTKKDHVLKAWLPANGVFGRDWMVKTLTYSTDWSIDGFTICQQYMKMIETRSWRKLVTEGVSLKGASCPWHFTVSDFSASWLLSGVQHCSTTQFFCDIPPIYIPETTEEAKHALKPLKLWAKINLSSCKLFLSGIFSQQWKLSDTENWYQKSMVILWLYLIMCFKSLWNWFEGGIGKL